MNLRLTLQHGIGLQQLFLDLIHLLALPTHCRHIWHHQLAGLWSRATGMSVESLPNLAEEQEQRAHPSLRRHSLSHIPAAERRSRIHMSGTVIASHHPHHHHCNDFSGWLYWRHESQMMYGLRFDVTVGVALTLLSTRHVLQNDSLDYKEAQKWHAL